MTEEQIALARRAVACKGWRWMAGMRALRDGRYWQGITDVRVSDPLHDGGYPGFFPDLEDPATMGCLLAMVREVWGKPAVSMFWGDYWQVVYTSDVEDGCAGHEHMGDGDTEAEALANALENAP